MRHEQTLRLYSYWNEKRAGRPAPDRSEIAPAALGALLPSVMLLERDKRGDIVMRLAGSQLCSLRCTELRDASFASLFIPDSRTGVRKILTSLENGNSVVVMDVFARRTGGSGFRLEMALFPLADEKVRILGIATAKRTPEWFGLVPTQLELHGLRHINPDADLAFLQSRPSIPLRNRSEDTQNAYPHGLQVINGKGVFGPKRAMRAFRVLEGGKK
ncbi:PAS domain-containing protein [Oricola sp.]|uniref:PAS domain-containing protein n=1 Tax=Oricola sp. TaxID=1979950 RepID=UPI0025E0AB2C|nr:PAS domain-containing protein [Oricola sp.]MCI5077021.1 PAS domain-containing protein [Oricola sp.]